MSLRISSLKQMLFLAGVIMLLVLGSCNVRPIVPPTVTIQLTGTINSPITNPSNIDISSTQSKTILTQALQKLDITEINQSIFSELQLQGVSTKDLEPPIRGLNALMLSRIISIASENRSFSGYQNTKVLVVKGSGEIIKAAQVEDNGDFSLELAKTDIGNEKVALVLAEEVIAGKTLCKQAFEYDPSTKEETEGENDNGVLDLSFEKLEQLSITTQQTKSVQKKNVILGSFGFSPETGKPENVKATTLNSSQDSKPYTFRALGDTSILRP